MTTRASRYVATFSRHNGNVDNTGNPTYSIPADWDVVADDIPVSLMGAGGGEAAYDRQQTERSTHNLYCDYWDGVSAGIDVTMRVQVNGETFSIVHIGNPDGIQREMEIEVKREV